MANFEQAKDYVFGRLERELPKNLFYHGIHHTRDDVLPAAERLASLEGVNGKDLLLLKTAALYHDLGYVEIYNKNEPIGVRIASETLPTFGYSRKQVEDVSKIIMVTQLQVVDGKFIQVPGDNLLEKIMCDADLDNLGRDDFYAVSDNLRRELKEYGIDKNLKEWYTGQIKFLEDHKYFTDSAIILRNDGKLKHLDEIKILVYGDNVKNAA